MIFYYVWSGLGMVWPCAAFFGVFLSGVVAKQLCYTEVGILWPLWGAVFGVLLAHLFVFRIDYGEDHTFFRVPASWLTAILIFIAIGFTLGSFYDPTPEVGISRDRFGLTD